MSMRILLGGLAAGIAVFIWSAVSHMVLPLGEAGIVLAAFLKPTPTRS